MALLANSGHDQPVELRSLASAVPQSSEVRTLSMACLTLSVVISPFSRRFATSAAFVAPEERQAMSTLLDFAAAPKKRWKKDDSPTMATDMRATRQRVP